MSTSSLNFTPPGTVTPGEYLVCSHVHYHKTSANARWHREVDEEEMRLDSYDNDSESESESDSDASSRASRSPSLFSRSGSNHTAVSTPPPDYDSRQVPVASSSRKPSAASGHRTTYRRLVVTESKAASQRSIAQKRKGRKKTAGAPVTVRSMVCQWGGCGERMADGKQLWNHIDRVHKPLGGEDGSKGAERGSRGLKAEEDMDVDEESRHVHADETASGDELDEDSSDDDWAESSRSSAVKKSQMHTGMDRYQVRIRCQWKRCTTTIQFAGLRRHIESKHSGLRNTSCPKGCGYVTNRPDMMPRHSVKCHYRGPRKEAIAEE